MQKNRAVLALSLAMVALLGLGCGKKNNAAAPAVANKPAEKSRVRQPLVALLPFGDWEGFGEYSHLLGRSDGGKRASATIRKRDGYPELPSADGKRLTKGIQISLRMVSALSFHKDQFTSIMHNEQFGIEGKELKQRCSANGKETWETVGTFDQRALRIEKMLRFNCREVPTQITFTAEDDGSLQVSIVNAYNHAGALATIGLRRKTSLPSSLPVLPAPQEN